MQQKAPTAPAHLTEGDIATLNASGLVKILTSAGSSEFAKAKACQRAGELGAKEAIPALAALLSDEKLSTYARYGLEPMADPEADAALRAALGKLKGNLLVGVVGSLSKRRDAQALPVLAKLMASPDALVAEAATAAVGNIGGAEAAKLLEGLLAKATGRRQMIVADALLATAERFFEAGDRASGFRLYALLSKPGIPMPARHAAMGAIIREERATTRPR
ncbi:MAG: hypothetical protein OHK0021_08950 [Bryobacter sp.]